MWFFLYDLSYKEFTKSKTKIPSVNIYKIQDGGKFSTFLVWHLKLMWNRRKVLLYVKRWAPIVLYVKEARLLKKTQL